MESENAAIFVSWDATPDTLANLHTVRAQELQQQHQETHPNPWLQCCAHARLKASKRPENGRNSQFDWLAPCGLASGSQNRCEAGAMRFKQGYVVYKPGFDCPCNKPSDTVSWFVIVGLSIVCCCYVWHKHS